MWSKRQCMVVVGCLAVLVGNAWAGNDEDYNKGLIAVVETKYEDAVKILEPLAKKGYAPAQFNLGLLYHRGLGVKQDERKAVGLYQKAAEAGHYKAQEFMATAYREGWFGMARDDKKAAYWMERIEQAVP